MEWSVSHVNGTIVPFQLQLQHFCTTSCGNATVYSPCAAPSILYCSPLCYSVPEFEVTFAICAKWTAKVKCQICIETIQNKTKTKTDRRRHTHTTRDAHTSRNLGLRVSRSPPQSIAQRLESNSLTFNNQMTQLTSCIGDTFHPRPEILSPQSPIGYSCHSHFSLPPRLKVTTHSCGIENSQHNLACNAGCAASPQHTYSFIKSQELNRLTFSITTEGSGVKVHSLTEQLKLWTFAI